MVKPENVDKLTSPEAMETWQAAFTHVSITGVRGENYEGLETVGDKFLGAIFVSYVDTILPVSQREPSYYTELVRYWLAKDRLAQFADELGFTNHIIYDRSLLTEVAKDVKEDVFEAFFGALVTVTNKHVAFGAGYIYAYNYFVRFIQDKHILLPEEELFPRKTKLKELFDGLQWGDVRYMATGNPNDPLYQVTVLDPERDVLSIGSGVDRRAAEEDAAVKAIARLAELGINENTLEEYALVDTAMVRLSERVTAFLQTKGSYGPLVVARLLRTTRDGERSMLVELRTTQDYETPQALVIQLAKGLGANYRQASIAAYQNFIKANNVP